MPNEVKHPGVFWKTEMLGSFAVAQDDRLGRFFTPSQPQGRPRWCRAQFRVGAGLTPIWGGVEPPLLQTKVNVGIQIAKEKTSITKHTSRLRLLEGWETRHPTFSANRHDRPRIRIPAVLVLAPSAVLTSQIASCEGRGSCRHSSRGVTRAGGGRPRPRSCFARLPESPRPRRL